MQFQLYICSDGCIIIYIFIRSERAARKKTNNNKNLAIANRSRVSCAHNTSRASIGLITHDLEILVKGHLEMWVIGHSRSLKMVPFESFGMVSYSRSIVTMAIYLAISQIFSIKNGLTLKYVFGVLQDHLEWRVDVE